jgi:hypothetical protein
MNRRIFGLAAAGGLLGLVGLAYVGYEEHAHETGWSLGAAHSQPVEQPIAFSHKIHVGERGISCTYCHQFVDKADYAGIPPMNTCLSCHKGIDVNALKDTSMTAANKKAELAKWITQDAPGSATLKDPANPPRWKRVYDLPNHVKFPHKVHVWALRNAPETEKNEARLTADLKGAGIGDTRTAATCLTCHGDIYKMPVVKQDVDLIRMGTCLNCHHQKGAVTDCFGCHY